MSEHENRVFRCLAAASIMKDLHGIPYDVAIYDVAEVMAFTVERLTTMASTAGNRHAANALDKASEKLLDALSELASTDECRRRKL
jgi:hypothetical protein